MSVQYTGILLQRNKVLKSTAKMYDFANTVQCVGRGKEDVIQQRNQKTEIFTHTVRQNVSLKKLKCLYCFVEQLPINGEEHREFIKVSEESGCNTGGVLDSLLSYTCSRPHWDFIPIRGSGFDCKPKETTPSPLKGFSVFTGVSMLPVSVRSCLTPAMARQL